ncbi:Hypothetical protein, putative [Bodo saltans]|uniref:Uncharacterized protein n=1 Tax=Bodo saltans TaxID=75058 RepID=A0A0S4JA40_BODSA|nr:Hypothetical protein, putative [Bodo saltans]|eukprot:CUG86354.1 Hypothetical protein, putative [Bodo saltans]
MVTSVVKSAHTALIFVWESKQNSAVAMQQLHNIIASTTSAGGLSDSPAEYGGRQPHHRWSRAFHASLPPESEWSVQLPALFLRLEESDPCENEVGFDDEDEDDMLLLREEKLLSRDTINQLQSLEKLIHTICEKSMHVA